MSDEIDLTGDTPQPSPKAAGLPWWVPVAAIIGVWFWFTYQASRPDPAPQPDDQSIVIEDDTQPSPQPITTDLKDSTLIYVYEGTAPTASQVEVMASKTTVELQARGMKGFRKYDQQQSEVVALVDYAVSKNTPPPFIALVRNKEPIKLAPFPASPAELEAFLK